MSFCLYFCRSFPVGISHLFSLRRIVYLWLAWPYHILPKYFINGMFFGINLSISKCVF